MLSRNIPVLAQVYRFLGLINSLQSVFDTSIKEEFEKKLECRVGKGRIDFDLKWE